MPDLLITTAADLTPAWFTACLRRGGALKGPTAVTAADVEQVGTGQMGACYGAHLTFDGPHALADRIIVKVPSADAGSRAFAAQVGAYDREVRFYREVAGQLAVRSPACYHAEVSDDGQAFVLLLEDLSPATECGQIEGCTPDQAVLALQQAAALHASSWHSPALERLSWLRSGLAVWRSFGQNALSLPAGLRARYGEQLDEPYLQLSDRLAAGGLVTWLERLQEPRCLWHCDFRLDNLLFDAKDGDVPIAVVDWQSVTLAQGTVDASYFLGSGLDVDARREHEEAHIRAYHESLVGGGVADYPWDEAWHDYRVNAVAGFVVAAISSLSVEQTERGDRMFLAMLRRSGQQMIDHGTLDLIGC